VSSAHRVPGTLFLTRERLRPLVDASIQVISRLGRGSRDTQDAHLAFLDSRDVELRRLRYGTPQDCTEMPAKIEAVERSLGLR
jgi:hypothetical protein